MPRARIRLCRCARRSPTESERIQPRGEITRPEALAAFAATLRPDDEVALEATSGARRVAEILRAHVGRVVIANTHRLAAVSDSKKKTDRNDARTLAQLLAAGVLEGSWLPDEQTRALRRRVSRRHNLVVARTRAKNEAMAVLHRNLSRRPPMSDPFGTKGRRWLGALELPGDEVETLSAALRQIDFLSEEIATIERELARFVEGSAEARRLMSVPGVAMITAATFLAQIGEIDRFSSPKQLVGYLGLDPRVRQSGSGAAFTGRISKEGSVLVRHVMVESAHSAIRTPGPLRAFYERVRSRRGHAVAIVATARRMVALFWHLLSRGEDYRHALELPTKKKLRKVELLTGSQRRQGGGPSKDLNREQRLAIDRARAQAAEEEYRSLVAKRQHGARKEEVPAGLHPPVRT
ncbi:MAG: IS110 family transposase [Actinobacteria bacterium]|nr:IS110 family transposase [Actinomycetota bacterium]